MKMTLAALIALILLPYVQLAQTATYDVTNPDVVSGGSFTGVLTYSGLRTSPYYSSLRTVNNIARNLDTMNQRISGAQHSVTTQFVYT